MTQQTTQDAHETNRLREIRHVALCRKANESIIMLLIDNRYYSAVKEINDLVSELEKESPFYTTYSITNEA